MSSREILEKAINKAIDGGWNRPEWFMDDAIEFMPDLIQTQIIFNHDFAKALWGNGTIITTPSMFGKLTRVHMGLPVAAPEPSTKEALIVRGWQYHLQQMVVAKDPVTYLGKNI